MHVSNGTNGKAGLNFGQLQKSSKVSISVTLFQVLKDLAEISASLGLSGEYYHVFRFFWHTLAKKPNMSV